MVETRIGTEKPSRGIKTANREAVKAWTEALRLRTLPLSVAGALVAGGLAIHFRAFRPSIFLLMMATVLLLQIVSNFADEYGDLEKGVDNEDRVGPKRGMQRGDITRDEMKVALGIGAALAFICGVALIVVAFGTENWPGILVFLMLGLFCIAGAIKYTVGANAYGYRALGDPASFLFFGVFAVLGGFYLYSHQIIPSVFLPMTGVGLLVTGVLNLNNMRDIINDKTCGKMTVAVYLGSTHARIYHFVLVIGGMVCFLAFPIISGITNPVSYLFILMFFPLSKQLTVIAKITDEGDYDKMMKPLSLSTAILSLLFAICVGL